MKRLSKSRYTQFCKCQKNLWLNAYKPEVAVVDASTEARFESGNEVGDLAMGLFGSFVEVTTMQANRSLDLAAMVEKTAIYEVKSTSFPEFEGQKAKLDKYAPDIAYQKWVLTQCGINVTGTYLVCLNSDYVRQGAIDLQRLFTIVDMEKLTENEYLKVPAQVNMALKVLNKDMEPENDLSEHCMKPYECPFLDYCKRQHGIPEDEPTVFDLYRMNWAKKLEHYHAGRLLFKDVREEGLSDKQQMQVECTLNHTEHIDKNGIREFLSGLSYPLYFLDFETLQQPIPQYDGQKPYQQITFQYSLHIKKSENAPYEHKEFLAPSDGKDPRRALAEQLCNDIPVNVCTLAYNMSFERGRIKELAELYPDLSSHLLNICEHIKGPARSIQRRLLLCTCHAWIILHQECTPCPLP